MSRHSLEPRDPHHEVSIGWDRPLANFYLQVCDHTIDEDTADPVIVWLGADDYATEPDVDRVLEEASKWAVVPQGVSTLLLLDRQCEGAGPRPRILFR